MGLQLLDALPQTVCLRLQARLLVRLGRIEAVRDGWEGVFGGVVLELAGLDELQLLEVARLLLLAVMLVEDGVLSLLEIHSSKG